MGYNTSFQGSFELDRPLTENHSAYLHAFAQTRRMKRDARKTAERLDPLRELAGLPVGVDGGYFVGAEGAYGQEFGAPDVLESSDPPEGQPGLWCQWVPNEEGTAIVYDGGEKFYSFVEWIKYLVEHFLEPWGYKVNGSVMWQGEDIGDVGKIFVRNNEVRVVEMTSLPEPDWDEDRSEGTTTIFDSPD
jgi:hypothetical protein